MKNPIIRTIYLYLFALTGLALLAIGVYRFLDLGLRTWVFTKAEQENIHIARPISISLDPEFTKMKSIQECSEKCELTKAQITAIDDWMEDYNEWKELDKELQEIDYRVQQRHRAAASALALLIVGLPLYLFHWSLIKKDIKENKA